MGFCWYKCLPVFNVRVMFSDVPGDTKVCVVREDAIVPIRVEVVSQVPVSSVPVNEVAELVKKRLASVGLSNCLARVDSVEKNTFFLDVFNRGDDLARVRSHISQMVLRMDDGLVTLNILK